ncbi:MAG TPA: hypothetical protein VEY30_12560 [Myxococcaceae bacterium]|nr:hypothetical protein [Myxococcaceae bacterium]
MKRTFGVLIAVVSVVAGGVIMTRRSQERISEAQREAGLARIQKDYLERVAWIRTNPDEKLYRSDAQSLFRWYFKEVNEHIKKVGGNPGFDTYLQELKARGGNDPQLPERKAMYDSVKRTFDAFRGGNYAPLWTATDKGVRIDVLAPELVSVAGANKIRIPVVVWGVPRDLRSDDSQSGRSVKKMVVAANFGLNTKLHDGAGKLFAEMNVDGGPSMKVDWPERYIAEFPPQMLLGHYDLDPIPAEIAKTELTFNLSATHPNGSAINAQYAWKLDPPPAWKLQAGQKWENAQESVRSEEEIDPAKAAAAAKQAGR